MEDRLGALLFMPYTYAKITSPTVTIDETLEIRGASLETYLREGLVRNAIDMEAVSVSAGSRTRSGERASSCWALERERRCSPP